MSNLLDIQAHVRTFKSRASPTVTGNDFPLQCFIDRLMGLDSVPFLKVVIDMTTYIKMKVVFWGKCQVANLRWRRCSINLVSTRLSINFR